MISQLVASHWHVKIVSLIYGIEEIKQTQIPANVAKETVWQMVQRIRKEESQGIKLNTHKKIW